MPRYGVIVEFVEGPNGFFLQNRRHFTKITQRWPSRSRCFFRGPEVISWAVIKTLVKQVCAIFEAQRDSG